MLALCLCGSVEAAHLHSVLHWAWCVGMMSGTPCCACMVSTSLRAFMPPWRCRRFATICPFAIVHGCNHAQFCNGNLQCQALYLYLCRRSPAGGLPSLINLLAGPLRRCG